MAACGRIKIDKYRLVAGLKTTGILPVHNTRARENCAQFIWMDGMWELFPVDEVRADSVSPGHVAPIDAEWVVLEEKMELAFVMDQAVRIVGPVGFRSKVELWTIRFLVSRLNH